MQAVFAIGLIVCLQILYRNAPIIFSRLMQSIIKRSLAVMFIVNASANPNVPLLCSEHLAIFHLEANLTASSARDVCYKMFDLKQNLTSNENLINISKIVSSLG